MGVGVGTWKAESYQRPFGGDSGSELEVSQPDLRAVKRRVGNCGYSWRVTQKMRNKCLIGPTSPGSCL